MEFFRSVYKMEQGTQGETMRLVTLRAIAEKEESNNLKKMDASKGAGPDGILLAIVKPMVEDLMKPVLQILTSSLNDGRPPAGRLTPTVTPMHKGRYRYNRESYRPVSLTTNVLRNAVRAFCDGTVNHLKDSELTIVPYCILLYIFLHTLNNVAFQSKHGEVTRFLAQTSLSNQVYKLPGRSNR